MAENPFSLIGFPRTWTDVKSRQSRSLTWLKSWGAGSLPSVSGPPRAAGLSHAASCWCTRLSSAAWWLCWSVPADPFTRIQYYQQPPPHKQEVYPGLNLHVRSKCAKAQLHCGDCTFMLGCELSVVTRLCKVSKPSLILKRRFCSAEMCVILLVSVCCR